MSESTNNGGYASDDTSPTPDPRVPGDLVERGSRSAMQLARHQQQGLAATPQVTARELADRLEVIREAMRVAMSKGTDYGVVPGTTKPGLLKPGAEKLAVLFQLDVQPQNELIWGPGDHLTVISRATVYHAPTGTRLGYGEGICTTREKKYATRHADLTCPACGDANIRQSKTPGEGYYCWRKTGGCGATFPEDDQRITTQTAGEIPNPDLPDLWNVVDKMSKKRATIDAILSVTGASEIFTQDIGAEENPDDQPAYGPAVDDELKPVAIRATITLCAGDRNAGEALWEQIRSALDGYMPQAAAVALTHTAQQLTARYTQELRAAASDRGLSDPELANVLRGTVGADPLDPQQAQAQLSILLERVTEPIARKALQIITSTTRAAAPPPAPVPAADIPPNTPTSRLHQPPTTPDGDFFRGPEPQGGPVSIDFGGYDPPPAA